MIAAGRLGGTGTISTSPCLYISRSCGFPCAHAATAGTTWPRADAALPHHAIRRASARPPLMAPRSIFVNLRNILHWCDAPIVEPSSGVALRRRGARRGRALAARRRHPVALVRRLRKHRRAPPAAHLGAGAPPGSLATDLLRGLRRHRSGRSVLR